MDSAWRLLNGNLHRRVDGALAARPLKRNVSLPLGVDDNMIQLPRNSTDEQILDVVRAWVELLAQERHEEAFQMLRYQSSELWSPELIKNVITNYGFIEPCADGAMFKVTSLKDNPGGKPFYEVYWYGADPNRPAEYLGMAAFNLPLNGEWSDVTAMFDIVEEDGQLVLELDDIHVL